MVCPSSCIHYSIPLSIIAQRAGQRILDIYERGFTITQKSDHTPLTEADLAAHDYIVSRLKDLTPDIPVLSEEACEFSLIERSDWDWLWLVDPLDGTREFINRSDQFSVNIALIHDHHAVFGVILIPVSNICYFAVRDGGAYKQAGNNPPLTIHTRRLDHQSVRVAGGRSYTGRPLQTYLEYMGRHQYLAVGSSLKSCLVAEGAVDLYPPLRPDFRMGYGCRSDYCGGSWWQNYRYLHAPIALQCPPDVNQSRFFCFWRS